MLKGKPWAEVWRQRPVAPAAGATAHQSVFGHPLVLTLTLLLICLPLTLGTILAFPIWDDGWFWLLLQEHGTGEIVASIPDRPVWAYLLAGFAISETVLWVAIFAAQAILWPLLGVLAALLWNHLFPELSPYAALVACVTVAPLVAKIHLLSGATFGFGPLLSIVGGYAALLMLLRFIIAPQAGKRWLLFGLGLFGAAILLTEYAVPVAGVALLLLLIQAWRTGTSAALRRGVVAVGLLGIVTVLAYGVYVVIGDFSQRPNVHPLRILEQDAFLINIGAGLADALWQSVVGGTATVLGALSFDTPADLMAVGYGLLVGGGLCYGLRLSARSTITTVGFRQRALVLVMLLAVGLLPSVMMGRDPWGDGVDSRFGVPVLPIAAMLTVLLAVRIVPPRFWYLPIIVLGFAAGAVTMSDVQAAITERQMMTQVGAALQPYVADDDSITAAVVALPERALGERRQWELTARLGAEWPAAQREHFWAFSARKGGDTFGERWACRDTASIDVTIRNVVRRGPIADLLWVAPQPDGTIVIEPYCLQ